MNHPPIQKMGEEFILSLFVYNVGAQRPDGTKYVTIPLFAPVMFNNLYSDVTENLAPSDDTSGFKVGVSGYGYDIWGAYYQTNFLGAVVGMFPYSSPQDFTYPNFGMEWGYGNVSIYNGKGFVGIQSQRMQYVNFLEWIKHDKVLLKNINVQVSSPLANYEFNQFPFTFFEQKISGEIYSIQTTPASWINPETNQQQRITAGGIKASSNFDIQCDWLIHKASGLSFAYDMNLSALAPTGFNIGYQLNFTFKKIIN